MEALAQKFAAILDSDQIVTDRRFIEEVAWDALSESRIAPQPLVQPQWPICVVQPRSTADVQGIVKIANEEMVPLVPFGGGSGLMGGALSIRPGVVIDTRSMKKILDIDPVSRSARVQCGVVLESLDERLSDHGFMLGHDPWTVPVATVGGAISTNSVGYRAGVYGSMGQQVLGLEAVLPRGEILRTRAVGKHSAGPNLNFLLIGGEGCFGVVTEATVRIFPRPESRMFAAVRFKDFETGYIAIQRCFEKRVQPALLDFGDSADKLDSGAMLYLVYEGNAAVIEAEAAVARSVWLAHGGTPADDKLAEEFWQHRHATARRFMANRKQRRKRGRDGIYRDWIHVALPSSKVLCFRLAAIELIERHGLTLQESGLWINPELFSLRLGATREQTANAHEAMQRCIEQLLRLVQELGGSMEYTHGIGVKLAGLMRDEHGYGLDVLRQFKKILDPNQIMNPGKMAL